VIGCRIAMDEKRTVPAGRQVAAGWVSEPAWRDGFLINENPFFTFISPPLAEIQNKV